MHRQVVKFLWVLIVHPWLQMYSCFVMGGTLCLFLLPDNIDLRLIDFHPNLSECVFEKSSDKAHAFIEKM